MNRGPANINSDANPRTTVSHINNIIPSTRKKQDTLDQSARENGDVDLASENIRLRDKTGMHALLAMIFYTKCFMSAVSAYDLYIYSLSFLLLLFACFLCRMHATIAIAAVMERLNDTESLLAASEAEAIYYQMQHQQDQHKLQTLLKQREETGATAAAAGVCNMALLLWWNVASIKY